MLEVAVQHERAGAGGYASVLLVSPDAERKLPEVRAALAAYGGASAFHGKLFARLTAKDGFTLRRADEPDPARKGLLIAMAAQVARRRLEQAPM